MNNAFKNDIKLSIIIPHKNDFGNLKRLIKTIPDQKQLEVIIVDDGSDPEKFNFLLRDIEARNVHIYSNETNLNNAGRSRNIGLNKAKGDWILFADSDDIFTENALQAINKYFEAEADIVFFYATSIDDNSNKIADRHQEYCELLDNYRKSSSNHNEKMLRYRFFPPWAKIIRKKLILDHDIVFDEIPASNDIMFSLKVGFYARKIAIENTVIYCVTKHLNSLTATDDYQRLISRCQALIDYNNFLRKNDNSNYIINGRPLVSRCLKLSTFLGVYRYFIFLINNTPVRIFI